MCVVSLPSLYAKKRGNDRDSESHHDRPASDGVEHMTLSHTGIGGLAWSLVMLVAHTQYSCRATFSSMHDNDSVLRLDHLDSILGAQETQEGGDIGGRERATHMEVLEPAAFDDDRPI